jgi:uncharacterized iron-regulated membrane protein
MSRPRSLWFQIHLWLGLGLGVWFALVGLTGSVLVFEDEIDAWLNPRLLTTAQRGATLPIDVLVARALETFAPAEIERLRLPERAGEVLRVNLRTTPQRRVGAERIEASFDPVTAQHLGSRPLASFGVSAPLAMATLYEFHRNVLLGEAGSNIVGIAGLLLLASTITGLVVAVWRKASPWKRLVWLNPRSHPTRIAFDAHRSAGVLFFVLLLLATITGATLVYLNYVRDIVSVFSPVASFPTIPWRTAADDPLPFAQVHAQVARAYPRHTMVEIHLPAQRTGGYVFYLRAPGDEHRLGDTVLWVHPVSAEILVERSDRTRNGGETLMHWLYPLHSGTAFGLGGRIAMSATGVVPLLLVLTGLWVWWHKRRGEQIGREKRAAARDR